MAYAEIISALNDEIEVLNTQRVTILEELRRKVSERNAFLRREQLLARYKGKIRPEDLEDLKEMLLESKDSPSPLDQVITPPVISVPLTAKSPK